MSDKETSDEFKLPLWLIWARSVLFYWSERRRASCSSVLVLLLGYVLASWLRDDRWLSGAASIVSSFGLVLMLKHYLLASIESGRVMMEDEADAAQCVDPEKEKRDPAVFKMAVDKKVDEMVGVLLTLFGALISGFGFLMPLADLS
ncbi:hypothetical protein EHS17_02455 [Rhodobacteraceae bacterium CH30]|nr:hypothetical protein EHS17_02455 [Rhodobacteraceae bacterium CH30]